MTMREWFEVMQKHRKKALADQKLTAEQKSKLDKIYGSQTYQQFTYDETRMVPLVQQGLNEIQQNLSGLMAQSNNPSIAAQLAYGEQCADTDGLALEDKLALLERGSRDAWKRHPANAGMTEEEYKALKRASPDEIAAIRADYELAKSCLVAERDALLRQVVRLTRERNDALAQIPAAGSARLPDETPRANPFAGGWATSWRMR